MMSKRESDMFLEGPPTKLFRDDLDDGSGGGRTGRVRKKSAKVIEMEEFEHIEKTAEKKPSGKKTAKKNTPKAAAQPDTPPVPERPKKVKNVKAISGTVVGDISRPVAMISTPVFSQNLKPARMITTPVNPKSVNKGVSFKLEPGMSDSSPIKNEIKEEEIEDAAELQTPIVTPITKNPGDGAAFSQPDQKSMIKLLLNSPTAGGKPATTSLAPESLTPIPITPPTPKQTGSKVAKKTKATSGEDTPKTPKATKVKKTKQEIQQQQSFALQDTSESDMSGLETSTLAVTPAPLRMKINLGSAPGSAVVTPAELPKPKKTKKVKQEVKEEPGHDSFTSDASPGFTSESEGSSKKPTPKKSKKKEKIMQDAMSAAAQQVPALANFGPPGAGISVSPVAGTKKTKKQKSSPVVAMSSPPEGQFSMSEDMEEEEEEEEGGLVIAEGQPRKKEKVLKKKASGKGKEKPPKRKVKPKKLENEPGKPVEKRAPTAYMLFCNTHRPAIVNENPGIEFAAISKKLGEMWQTLSNKQKLAWRRKSQHRKQKKEFSMIFTGKPPTQAGGQGPPGGEGQGLVTLRGGPPAPQRSPRAPEELPQGPTQNSYSIEPIDVAAHLKLLGESLSIIGMRLQEHKGMIAVQGSLSVLLDSFVCACGPLLCLTQQVPGLDGCPPLTHARTLDSVAYVMPGL